MDKFTQLKEKITADIDKCQKELDKYPARWQIGHARELQNNTLETRITVLQEVLDFLND